jgi:hypothetical protein
MSASAPAGSPTSITGRVVAVCISATITGESESEVMNQAPPTFCIQVPTFDTTPAAQSERKSGSRSGLHAETPRAPGLTTAASSCGSWLTARAPARSPAEDVHHKAGD